MKLQRSWVLMAVLVLVWGVNWPLTKMALPDCPPILFAGLRTAMGGLLLLGPAISLRRSLYWRAHWPVYLISTAFNIVLYYGLQTVGLKFLPSGLFSTIVFLQPVLVGLLSWVYLGEGMNVGKGIGFTLGIGGVAVISLHGLAGHVSILGIILAVLTSFAWSIGTVYVKAKGHHVNPMGLVCIQLMVGGAVMLSIGSATESWSAIDWTPMFLALLTFISIFVIAMGWWIFFMLIQGGSAAKVASFTFLIPLISIVSSAILLGESITVSLFVGLVLIITSLILVNQSRV